jgi:LysR family glycine cleavage system transcriptional activator
LVVSVLPSVGVRWLNRALPEFLREHPDLRVDLRLEEDPVDFFRTRIDVRVSYGEHIYPEFVTIPIIRDRVTVMCTPAFAAEHQLLRDDPSSLRDEDLIHICWRTGIAAYPTWASWFESAGAPRQVRRELGHSTDISSLAIDLARSGTGVALAQCWLAQDELRNGTLVMPFKTTIDLQYRYCAVHARGNARNPGVRAFVDWLCVQGAQLSVFWALARFSFDARALGGDRIESLSAWMGYARSAGSGPIPGRSWRWRRGTGRAVSTRFGRHRHVQPRRVCPA